MYFQFPIESLARRRANTDQLAFAREARHVLADSEDLMLEPLGHGLAILAAHEDALEEHALGILAELNHRGSRILEECTRSRIFIVRAEAPMAALLGLPARLDELTQGLATHSISLVRYSPVRADLSGAGSGLG